MGLDHYHEPSEEVPAETPTVRSSSTSVAKGPGPSSESPVETLLKALDRLDVDAAVALAAPDVHLLVADGRQAEGRDAVRGLLEEFLGVLSSSTHQVIDQWHAGDAWIAVVDASYELLTRTRLGVFERAFILREGPAGLVDLRVYGAHEHQLGELEQRPEMRIGGRWIPPL